MTERRSHERICIDAPVMCELVIQSHALPVLLKDISKGGAQVEIGPARKFTTNLLGEAVSVCMLPDELPGQPAGLSGVVSWVSPERMGIRFHTVLTISSAELEAILRRC